MSLEISKGIEKLYQCVSNGLGDILIPQDVRYILGNQIKQLDISQNGNTQKRIDIASTDSNSIEEIHQLYDHTCARMIWQEMKKQKNIESVVEKTKTLLEKENNISEEKVDEDWINRFFNSVQDISNEKMQILWSKILAGEIKVPNTFSLRFLDAMTKVSQEEAQLFEKYSLHMIKMNSRIAIIRDEQFGKEHNISYDDILVLQECNLIDANPLLSLTYSGSTSNETLAILQYNDKCIIVQATDNKSISIPVYQLTRLGKELYHIINVKFDNDYFRDVAKYLANHNKDKIVTLHTISAFGSRSIQSIEPEIITPD